MAGRAQHGPAERSSPEKRTPLKTGNRTRGYGMLDDARGQYVLQR